MINSCHIAVVLNMQLMPFLRSCIVLPSQSRTIWSFLSDILLCVYCMSFPFNSSNGLQYVSFQTISLHYDVLSLPSLHLLLGSNRLCRPLTDSRLLRNKLVRESTIETPSTIPLFLPEVRREQQIPMEPSPVRVLGPPPDSKPSSLYGSLL